MINILRTVLGQSSEEYASVIEALLDPEKKMLISSQERMTLEFLQNSWNNARQFPSMDYFLSEFDEYEVPLQSAKVLSVPDLKIHYANMIKTRVNRDASKALMNIAAEVAQSGMTYEHLDKIRSYYSVTENDFNLDVTSTAELFSEYYQSKKQQPLGMVTCVKEIDDKIGGIAPGTTMVLAGYVGSYKTTFGLNIAYNNAKKLNYNVCYVSLEMPKEELMFNLLSRHSFEAKFPEYPYIPHDKIRKCLLTEDEEKYVFGKEISKEDGSKEIDVEGTVLKDLMVEGGQIRILDEADFRTFSMSEIREKLEAVDDEMMETTGHPLDAVVWDHANLFKFNGSNSKKLSETAEGNEYVSFIRKLSIAFRKDKETGNMRKLAMLILAQVNRDGWKRAVKNKGRYDMRALAEINELERAAQVILMIFTDDAMKMAKEAVITMPKNRNGITSSEPISVFVDPEAYVAGEEMEGFSEMLEMDDFENVFGGGGSVADMFN